MHLGTAALSLFFIAWLAALSATARADVVTDSG